MAEETYNQKYYRRRKASDPVWLAERARKIRENYREKMRNDPEWHEKRKAQMRRNARNRRKRLLTE